MDQFSEYGSIFIIIIKQNKVTIIQDINKQLDNLLIRKETKRHCPKTNKVKKKERKKEIETSFGTCDEDDINTTKLY